VDDLADFIENGLYDPAFVRFDPNSPTKMFELSPPDFLYSVYRPDLAALGAIDGRPASGRPQDNDDALSRRDAGLEFLDVTTQLHIDVDSTGRGSHQQDVVTITNNSASVVDTHLLVVVQGLADRIQLENADGITSGMTRGDPYVRVFLPDGVLLPGQTIVETLRFRRESHAPPISYTLKLLSGQGNP